MKGGLRYELGFRQSWEVRHRAIGSLVHLYCAYHYGLRCEVNPPWINDHVEDYEDEILAGCTTDDRVKWTDSAKRTMRAYKKRWASEALIPLAAELELVATLGEVDPGGDQSIAPDSEIVTARYDLIALRNGEVEDIDFKCSAGNPSKGELAKFEPEQYEASRQIIEQIAIMQARIAMPIRGASIRRIMREVPYDSDHQTLSISPVFLKSIGKRMRTSVGKRLEARRRLDAHKPWRLEGLGTDMCTGDKWGPCDYLVPCRNPPQDRLVILKNSFRRGEELYQRSEDRS